MMRCHLLKLHEHFPDFSLVADRLLEPFKLLGTQGHSNSFWSDTPRPLIARTALTGLVAFHKAAQGNPADLGEFVP